MTGARSQGTEIQSVVVEISHGLKRGIFSTKIGGKSLRVRMSIGILGKE